MIKKTKAEKYTIIEIKKDSDKIEFNHEKAGLASYIRKIFQKNTGLEKFWNELHEKLNPAELQCCPPMSIDVERPFSMLKNFYPKTDPLPKNI